MTATVRQAIILAAGEGRRLRPITLTTPKPLVPMWGRPLLDWSVDALARAGVTRIAINAFHLADQIAAHVASLSRRLPQLTLHLSREPTLLGTGGAVRHLRDWLLLDEPFFVLNSDAIFAEPVTRLTHAPSLLVTRAAHLASERRIVSRGDRWSALVEASDPGAFTFCGLTLADAALPQRLPDGPSCILRQGFVPWLDAMPVTLAETTRFFADTGTPRALIAAHHDGLAWAASRSPPCPAR